MRRELKCSGGLCVRDSAPSMASGLVCSLSPTAASTCQHDVPLLLTRRCISLLLRPPRCYMSDVVSRGGGSWEAAAAAPPPPTHDAYTSPLPTSISTPSTAPRSPMDAAAPRALAGRASAASRRAVQDTPQAQVPATAAPYDHMPSPMLCLLMHASYAIPSVALAPPPPPADAPQPHGTPATLAITITSSRLATLAGRFCSLMLGSATGLLAWVACPFHALAHGPSELTASLLGLRLVQIRAAPAAAAPAPASLTATALDAAAWDAGVLSSAWLLLLLLAGTCAAVCVLLLRSAHGYPTPLHGA